MTKQEFTAKHENRVFRHGDHDVQVFGFDDQTQMIGIRYLNGVKSAIKLSVFLSEINGSDDDDDKVFCIDTKDYCDFSDVDVLVRADQTKEYYGIRRNLTELLAAGWRCFPCGHVNEQHFYLYAEKSAHDVEEY